MAEEKDNNQQEHSDITDFLRSLKEDEKQSTIGGEGFPFSDNFDIDAFVNQNAAANSQPQPQLQPQEEDDISRPKAAVISAEEESDGEELPSAEEYEGGLPEGSYGLEGEESLKEQTIKHLEDKIAELESRFEDVNKEKSFASAMKAELEDDKEDIQYVPTAKANDEFFQNISTTIETLKGSLENIVSARLQYEESLIRQDQSLITRLREKTTRLKAINLALNSEVKRAKNEKLENLRRSAEQTKELLSLRMQLTKVEEKARHGDFKLSRLEQQFAVVNAEKLSLDEEIRQVREEKLENLRRSAEQTKQIMTLRLELTRTEEKYKQEEVQTQFLREQLKTVEEQRAALDGEVYSTRSEREDAKRRAAAYERQIQSLKSDVARQEETLTASAQEAGALKEKVLSLESELQHLQSEKETFQLKTQENLRRLEEMRVKHEQDIEKIRQEQLLEIENIRNQKTQEAQGVVLELRRAEDKYRQEQTFVNTLKLQIESLSADVKNLQTEKSGISAKLSQEIEIIKQGHQAEIDNLQKEYNSSKERLEKEETAYNSLKRQLENLEKEKYDLNEEIKKVLGERDEALSQNAKYLEEIDALKKDYAQASSELKDTLTELKNRQQDERQALEGLKVQYEEELAQKDLLGREKIAGLRTKYEEELSRKDIENGEKLSGLKAKYEEDIKQKDAAGKEAFAKLESRQKELEEALSLIKERENIINLLNGDLSSLEVSRAAVEAEFKKASAERCDILKQLEDRDKELTRYREAYEKEVSALRLEKENQARVLGDKLSQAQTRLKESEDNVASLKDQIAALEEERTDLNLGTSDVREDNVQKAKKIAEQTEEILSLRSRLTKAESKFLQDTVLINQLREQFTVMQGSVRVLEQEVSKLKLENEAVKEDSAAKAREIAALKNEISKTKEELERETLNVRNLQAHTSELKAINSSLDEEIKKAQTEKLSALQKSAEQAKEILVLKEQLERAETGFNSLGFQNGLVSLRKEYEQKVVQLETDLKDASALCAKQVKEIQQLRTDNIMLRNAEEERVRKEERFTSLTKQVETLTEQLEEYKKKENSATALVKVKAAALGAQITRVTQDRDSLKIQLEQTQKQIKELTEREKEKQTALSTLKEQIDGNDSVIQNLKREIMLLTAENKNLKELQKVSQVHQEVLATQLNKVESESKKLSTMYGKALLKDTAAQEEQEDLSVEEPAQDELRQEGQEEEPFVKSEFEQREEISAEGELSEDLPEETKKIIRYVRTTTPEGKKVIKRIVVRGGGAQEVSAFGEKTMRAKAFKPVASSITGKNIPLAQQRASTELMRQAAGRAEEGEQLSLVDLPEPQPLVEEVNLGTEEMDLSAIFKEDTFTVHQPKTEFKDTALTNTLKDTTIKPMAVKAAQPELGGMQIDFNQADEPIDVPYAGAQNVDHSARQHGIERKPMGRVPQSYRESQAYSDFLKKTRSMFFRIKWSLFKE